MDFPLSDLDSMLSSNERARLASHGIERCQQLVEWTQAPETRAILAQETDITPDRLIVLGAMARLNTLVLPGADVVRCYSQVKQWRQLDPQMSRLPEWLLTAEPELVVEHLGDVMRYTERQETVARAVRGTGRSVLAMALLFLICVSIYAWQLRSELFGYPGTDSLAMFQSFWARHEAKRLLGAVAMTLAVPLAALVVFAAAGNFLSVLNDRLAERLLRLRGLMAVKDLAVVWNPQQCLPEGELASMRSQSNRRPGRFVSADALMATWLIAGWLLAVLCVWMGKTIWLEEVLLLVILPGLLLVTALDVWIQRRFFERQRAAWMESVQERFAQFRVFHALLLGSVVLFGLLVLGPWTLRQASNYVGEVAFSALRADFFEMETALSTSEFTPEQRQELSSWGRQLFNWLFDQLESVQTDITASQSVLATVQPTLTFIVIFAVFVMALGQFALTRWKRGVTLMLLWLLLYVVAQYGPGLLGQLVPVPAAWMRALAFVVMLPLVAALASDFFYAYLERGRSKDCPDCSWSIGTGQSICTSCGRQFGD